MYRNILVACLLVAVMLGSPITQSVASDGDMIEYDRRLAENHKTVFPAAGVVPDAETAKSIALAVAIIDWGEKYGHIQTAAQSGSQRKRLDSDRKSSFAWR